MEKTGVVKTLKLWKLIVAGALLALIPGCLASAAIFDKVVDYFMTPAAPFAPETVPTAPDYSSPSAWSALPERQDAADASLPALPAIDQTTAPVDVFYVHPTSYVGSRWNGPVDDARLNADTDRVATGIQASVFNGCCAIYAPRYRQANGTSFYNPGQDGQKAREIAYTDVREAFHRFLARTGAQRPFILASHSQGTWLAYRLLREEISRSPLRQRLVGAWLIGGPITEEAAARDIPDIAPCAAPDQVGCIAAWNARGPEFRPGHFEFRLPSAEGLPTGAQGTRLCVNPLSWRHDEVAVEAAQNRGAVFLEADPPRLMPGFASARCLGGTLLVSLAGKPPRDFMSRILDRSLGADNFHPIEYQIFFADIRHNAAERVAAWLRLQSVPAP